VFKLLKINNIFIILAIISGMTAYILHTSYLKTKYQIKTHFSNDSLLISEWIKSEFKASDYVLRDIISQTLLSELQYPPTDPEKY